MEQKKDKSSLWIALVVIGALLGALGLSRILNVIVAAAVGGIAGSLVALLISRTREATSSASGAAGPAKGPASSTPSDAELLNQVNLRIRSRGVAPDLVARIEQLIDRVAAILPTLGGEYSGFELTWQMQRIANSYLPKLVDAYTLLSDAQRVERRGEFETSLGELEDAVARTSRVVDDKNTAEFSNVSAFLKLRFS